MRGAQNKLEAPVTRRGLVSAAALAAAGLAALPLVGCGAIKREEAKEEAAHNDPAAGSSVGTNAQTPATVQLNKVTYPEAVKTTDFEKLEKLEAENPVGVEFLGSLETFSNTLTTHAVGEFAFDAANPNACVSPVGMYLALAMLAQGARGDTQAQLLAALGVSDADALAEQCRHLLKRLWARTTPADDEAPARLNVANSLWLHGGVPFEKHFLDKAAKDFYAEVFEVREPGHDAATAMGDWVAQHTGAAAGPQFTLADGWLASILSTLWYQGCWNTPFNENDTAPGTFYGLTGEVPCDFMTQQVECAFVQGDGYKLASMPLTGNAHLAFLLPDEGVDPQAFLARDTGISQLFGGLANGFARVQLTLPKASMETHAQLADVLQLMGVASAFAPDADFSGMTSGTVHLSDVAQGARLALNEMGVEASSYTQLAVNVTSVMATDAEVIEMRLDRPFAFRLTDVDGVVLLAGVMGAPTAA